MKVKDQQAWALQESELKNADEASLKFLEFLEFWVGGAEKILEEKTEFGYRHALIEAFNLAEKDLGFLSVEWLGQMLLVIVQYWFGGDELWESLSSWERRMIEQATALKLVELERMAAGDEPEDSPEV